MWENLSIFVSMYMLANVCRNLENLMFLKTYDGNAEDLCLTFTVANDNFGTNTEIELIPNGANIDVTDTNKHHYIGEF